MLLSAVLPKHHPPDANVLSGKPFLKYFRSLHQKL